MIHICQPDIGDAEKAYVLQAMDENELSGHGKHVKLFEEKFAEYIGVQHAIMVPNGTIALHLALAAVGVGPRDEVVLPSQTISCCAFAVTQLGAVVVPVDITRDTWTMDPNDLKKAITNKTKAVIPTPVFAGVCPDIVKINAVCRRAEQHVNVIVDFAEAIGSIYHGKQIGSYGIMGCCSFFANKTIQTGEGGMIVTSSHHLDERLRFLRNNAYGKDMETKFLAAEQAYNYRPQNLQAAIGLGQMDRLEYLVGRRQQIHSWYKERLSPKFRWQKWNDKEQVPCCWMNTVLLPLDVDRRAFMEHMMENGIETRPTFPPIGMHPYLVESGKVRSRLEINSTIVWNHGVLLPSGGVDLTEEVVEHICDIANAFIEV